MMDSRNHRKRKSKMRSFRHWVERNKLWIAIAGAVICVAVIATVLLLGKKGKDQAEPETVAEESLSAATEAEEVAVLEEVEVPNDLLLDMYPEINNLINSYYSYMAAGDVEGVKSLVDVLTEDEQKYIESLKTLIEGYQNIRCYTKRGIEDNSYLVFVRYDLKFIAVDSVAPGVQGYYVKTNADGTYYIFLDTPDEALTNFVNEIVQDEDVQQLYAEVWVEFEAAKAADEKLAEYGTKLEQLKNAGLDEPEGEDVEETGTEEGTGEDTSATEEETPEETTAGEVTAVNRQTRFKESTNVRSERTTDSSRIALGYQGETVTQVESYPDGWSKIIFNGKEGYCKTEFLE